MFRSTWKRAAASYRASADGGHDWGQYNLGSLLFDGRGVALDRPQALRWFLRAASQGHGRAMNLVAQVSGRGLGLRPQRGRRGYWYYQSARSGYFRGQFNYAVLLRERGLPEAAADWFLKAAVGGSAKMRRAIASVLTAATHPALQRVRARVLELSARVAERLGTVTARAKKGTIEARECSPAAKSGKTPLSSPPEALAP